MDVVITLLSPGGYAKDADGIDRPVAPTRRDVFAKEKSVTRAEFFSGGRNDLSPERMFEMFAGDYAGERELLYNTIPYSIYRTYKPEGKDYIELYAERSKG